MSGKAMNLLDDARPERLHPDLQPWIQDGLRGGKALKHPLVYELIYTPIFNARLNAQYEQKLKAIKTYAAEGNHMGVLIMHERPYRLDAFLRLTIDDDVSYWKLLAWLWTDTENMWQNRQEWVQALSAERPGRVKGFMSPAGRKVFKALPAEVKIYRGYSTRGTWAGQSWTLSRSRAEWFAKRLCFENEEPWIASAYAPHKLCIAYLDERGEQEIVVAHPEHLHGLRVRALEAD